MRGAEDIIGQHTAHLEYLNRRPSTVYQRRLVLARLATFGGCEAGELLQLGPETLQQFVGQRHLHAEARANSVSHVRGFFKWACEEGLLDADPSLRLKRPKRSRRLPRPMDDHDVSVALGCDSHPLREWFHLAAYAGLRCCEICQLRGRDFRDLGSSSPWLYIKVSKGGSPSTVPLGAPLRAIAEALAAVGNDWCFPKGRGGDGHVTAAQLQKRGNAWLHENGIKDTMHQLRHWYGTKVYAATGQDLRTTQELMRHTSPVSTAGYTQIDRGQAARALDTLPRL